MQATATLRAPVAWMIAAGFLVLEGVSFAALVAVLSDPARPAPIGAVLEQHFGGSLLGWAIQLTVLAALAARAAEDRRTGVWESLVAAPISEGTAVVGSWLGAWLVYALLWLPTTSYVAIVLTAAPAGTSVDAGPLVAGYLGQLVVGGVALAFATAAGAAARHPVVAIVAGFAALLAWLVVGEVPTLIPALTADHPTLAAVIARTTPRAMGLATARGAIEPATVAWVVVAIPAALLLATALVGVGRRRSSAVALASYRAALGLTAAALVAVVVDRSLDPWDVTAEHRNRLAPATRRALDAVPAPVTATVVRPGMTQLQPLYDEVERVLGLFARHDRRIRVERWDPATDPATAMSLAAQEALDARELVRGGAVVLRQGPRTRAVALLDLTEVGRDAIAAPAFTRLAVEAALARAFAELGAPAPWSVCWARGGGELPPDAWPGVVARLRDDSTEVVEIDPRLELPSRCGAIVVVGTTAAWSPTTQQALEDRVVQGAGLVVAVPGANAKDALPGSGPFAVLRAAGIVATTTAVVDPALAIDLPGGLRIVDGYADHPIVRGFAGRRPTVWQHPRLLELSAPATPLVSTSAQATAQSLSGWTVPVAAPFAVAATSQLGRGRVVVLTGAESIGIDPSVRGHGTDLLAARAIAWVLGRTPEVAVPIKAGDRVRLVLTRGEQRWIAVAVIGGLPALVVLLLIAAARRRRR